MRGLLLAAAVPLGSLVWLWQRVLMHTLYVQLGDVFLRTRYHMAVGDAEYVSPLWPLLYVVFLDVLWPW